MPLKWQTAVFVAFAILATTSAWLYSSGLGYKWFADHDPHFSPAVDDPGTIPEIKGGIDLSLDEAKFASGKWGFQFDVSFPLPKFDVDKLKLYTPKNWRGPGLETYALFFATRNATMHDPYFNALLQIIYRLLWDPQSKTSLHTVVVYVPPFISDVHRDYFKAAGAIVREVGFHPFVPIGDGTLEGRLADVLDKLDLWAEDDFSLIAYLDADAFPIVNVDSLFTTDLAVKQECRRDLLQEEDKEHADDFCDYVFSAAADPMGLNAGVMVLKPNKQLHSLLFRDSKKQDEYDNGFPEQALLHHFYREDGPMPWHEFSHPYNAGADNLRDKKDVFIVHAKLWDPFTANSCNETKTMFSGAWADMVRLYESPRFREMRAVNGTDLSAHRDHPTEEEIEVLRRRWARRSVSVQDA